MSNLIKELPIILIEQDVRWIREGRKTAVRSPVKMPRKVESPRAMRSRRKADDAPSDLALPFDESWQDLTPAILLTKSPYGRPGDHLWGREAWRSIEALNHVPARDVLDLASCWYEESGPVPPSFGNARFRPAMSMPRRFSRILLEVLTVRIEQLHDITDEQAVAEGFGVKAQSKQTPREGYASYWDYKEGNWDANPWVWVAEFTQVAQ